jgi:hypothetical protein
MVQIVQEQKQMDWLQLTHCTFFGFLSPGRKTAFFPLEEKRIDICTMKRWQDATHASQKLLWQSSCPDTQQRVKE